MINILQLSDSFTFWWTQKVKQILSKYLNKYKYKVYAWWYFSWWERKNIIESLWVETIVFYWDYFNLKKFIIKNNINIIHFHRSNNFVLELYPLIKKDFPNIKILETNAFWKITKSKIEKLVDYRIFVSFFCANRFIKSNNLSNDIFLLNNTIIYNPIDIDEKVNITTDEIKKFKISLWIKDNEIVLWRLWRKDNYKFSNLCINFLPYLVRNNIKFKYLIMGLTESKRNYIKSKWLSDYIIEIDNTSNIKDLAIFYNTIDILCHTSLIGESFWYIYVEAMMYWKPILTNSTPDKDNAQIELVKNWINWYIWSNPKDFYKNFLKLNSDKDALNLMKIKNKLEYIKFDINNQLNFYECIYDSLFLNNEIENHIKSIDLERFKIEYLESLKHIKKDFLYDLLTYKERLLVKINNK